MSMCRAVTMVDLMVNSQDVLRQGGPSSALSPWGEPLLTHASTGGHPALAGSLVQSPVGSLLLSSGS